MSAARTTKHAPYSLIVLDVDGTLINSSAPVSDGDRVAIEKAKEAGVSVVLATGKSWPGLRPVAEDLAISPPYIVVNGTKIVGLRRRDTFLAPQAARRAIETARRFSLPWALYMENDRLVVSANAIGRLAAAAEPLDNMSTTSSEGRVLKVLYCIDEGDEGAEAVVRRELEHLPCRLVRASPHFFEVIPPGADKGRALRVVLEHLGVDAGNCMAVGDAQNDLPMFAAAGLGVAVATAPEAVKRGAGAVAPPGRARDGVAWAIEQFVL